MLLKIIVLEYLVLSFADSFCLLITIITCLVEFSSFFLGTFVDYIYFSLLFISLLFWNFVVLYHKYMNFKFSAVFGVSGG